MPAWPKVRDDGVGQAAGIVDRAALGHRDQGAGDACSRERRSCRAILARRQRLGLAVARHFRQRIDGGAANLGFGMRVGMDRQEQIGFGRLGPRHPLAQRDIGVGSPGSA